MVGGQGREVGGIWHPVWEATLDRSRLGGEAEAKGLSGT